MVGNYDGEGRMCKVTTVGGGCGCFGRRRWIETTVVEKSSKKDEQNFLFEHKKPKSLRQKKKTV